MHGYPENVDRPAQAALLPECVIMTCIGKISR